MNCDSSESIIHQFNRFRPRLNFRADSGCFICLVPTKVCSGPDGNHEFEGLLQIFMVLMFQYSDYFSSIFSSFFDDLNNARKSEIQFYQNSIEWQWGPLDTEVMKGTALFFNFMEWFNSVRSS